MGAYPVQSIYTNSMPPRRQSRYDLLQRKLLTNWNLLSPIAYQPASHVLFPRIFRAASFWHRMSTAPICSSSKLYIPPRVCSNAAAARQMSGKSTWGRNWIPNHWLYPWSSSHLYTQLTAGWSMAKLMRLIKKVFPQAIAMYGSSPHSW